MSFEFLRQVGAVIGLVVGLISLGQQIMLFRNKQRERATARRRKTSGKVALLHTDPYWSPNYLGKQEIAVILSTAVLINAVSFALVTHLTSILYLDMTGTAIAALLLGPWYGAIAGLLSSGLVNVLLFSGTGVDGYDKVFPWALVNICGGLLWGQFGRSPSFASYMASENCGLERQVLNLLKFGVLGAAIMAVPGTGVELAFLHQGILNPKIAEKLQLLMQGWVPDTQVILAPIFGESRADSIARWAVVWVKNTAIYIPDKTLSFAISIIAIKAAFPLFERELIHSRVNVKASAPGWLDPSLLLVTVIPYTAILALSKQYGWHNYWGLWTAPIWVALIGMALESMLAKKGGSRRSHHRLQRQEIYEHARGFLPLDAAARPGTNFAVACLAACLLFVLILQPLVSSSEYYKISFNFFCLVYGFQLMLYLYGVTLSQNLALRVTLERPVQRDMSKVG